MTSTRLSQGFLIGILTKPDMLGDGAVNARQLWLDVIEGRQHELKHGYYCVRLPDDAQRAQRLSGSALQRIATDYFNTTSPWSGVTDRGRFGIAAFVTDISVLLVSHINKVYVAPQYTRISLCTQQVIIVQHTTAQTGRRAITRFLLGGDWYFTQALGS